MNKPSSNELSSSGRLYCPETAAATLARLDPMLVPVIDRVAAALPLRLDSTPYQELLRSIVYQQISTRAAQSIYARLLKLFPHSHASANTVSMLDDDALRAAGMSRGKITAVRALTAAAKNGQLPSPQVLSTMDDEAIIKQLGCIHGIGRWTAEMLLIFYLGRPDVLPVSDLGVRRGFMIASGGDILPTPTALKAYGQCWRPYRSVAAWYLWRAND